MSWFSTTISRQASQQATPVRSPHGGPRWEDIDPDDVDYKARNGQPTGYERDLASLRHRITTTEAQLKRYFRELGINSGGDLVDVQIPAYQRFRDPFAFDRARRAKTAQSNLESHRRRFCELHAKHREEKVRLATESGQTTDTTTNSQ